MGKFGGPQLPHHKSHENSVAGRHPFGPSTTTWKNRKSFCDSGLVTGRYFWGVLYGEIAFRKLSNFDAP